MQSEIELLSHTEVTTVNHAKTYNDPNHDLMILTTDDIQVSYTPLGFKRNDTHCVQNPRLPEPQIINYYYLV